MAHANCHLDAYCNFALTCHRHADACSDGNGHSHPSRHQQAGPDANANQGARPLPGSAYLRITSLNYSAQDEVVTIPNDEARNVPMNGWRLISVVGTQKYTFPADYVLPAGADLRVHSWQAAGTSSPPGDLRWLNG